MKSRTVLIVVAIASVTACSAAPIPESSTKDIAVLATVADQPIGVDDVVVYIPADPLPDVIVPGLHDGPWREAVDREVRDQLLDLEAQRREIVASTRSERISLLITQEEEGRRGFTSDSITEDEARRWFADHRHLFGRVSNAKVDWAEFDGYLAAREALEQSGASSSNDFLAVARESGAKSTGNAVIDRHGDGADPMIVRAAFAVGQAGGFALSEDPQNVRWWLVRVNQIQFDEWAWNPTLSHKVKTAMTVERREEHLDVLVESLQKKWPVCKNEDSIDEVSQRKDS